MNIKKAVFACMILFPACLLAAPPDLRDQVSLNGTWDFRPNGGSKTSIPVPEFWDANPGFSCTWATYERSVNVPSSWSGKVIKVEFEGINHIAEVYVNGTHVCYHLGGWVPFQVDITSHVSPSSSFQLKVDVKGGSYEPIVNSSGMVQWPVGWYGHESRWGIIHDVWLRAYGTVHIEDAFIKTSYRSKTITVEYTIKNSGTGSKTVDIEADAKQWGSSTVEKTFSQNNVNLSAGETKTVTLTESWQNPALWSHDSPNLYVLESRIKEGAATVDSETRRFGFKEMWIESNQFILNGTQINLLGDSLHHHSQGYSRERYNVIVPSKWNSSIDKLFSQNINMVRFHQCPAPKHVIETADERGLMVIEESAVYSRAYLGMSDDPARRAIHVANCKKWIEPWAKDRRNHASIILWSVENEMNCHRNNLTVEEIGELVDTLRLYDDTRPIGYGETIGSGVAYDVVNCHYIARAGDGVPNDGSIYRFASRVHPTKPTGVGEFLYCSSRSPDWERSRWWQSLYTRGYRYTDFNDIRPYTLDWAWYSNPSDSKAQFLKRTFARVALFDHDYDDIGPGPVMDEDYPDLDEGIQIRRDLVLYNDELSDTSVTVEVTIKRGSTTYAKGSKTYSLELGRHFDIACRFQVPYIGSSYFDMVLTTKKGGVTKFEETKRFNVTDTGASGSSSGVVMLEDGVYDACYLITGATAGLPNEAYKLYDGRLATAYGAGGDGANAWFQLDIGTSRDMSMLKAAFRYDTTLKIEVGDGALTEVYNGPVRGLGKYPVTYVNIEFPSTSGRYIKVTDENHNNWFTCQDAQVWGGGGGSRHCPRFP